MFQLTTLGHQSFYVETSTTRLFMDPLLVEALGHGGVMGSIWPPREYDVAKFPTVHAVVYTHEHEDHFNIPTLNRLARDIPIWLPERCSIAARTILKEMGFTFNLYRSGEEFRIGDLIILPLSAIQEQRAARQGSDEYDCHPMFIRDVGGHGSFYTAVDMADPPDLLERLKELVPRPGIWGYTTNMTDWSLLRANKPSVPREDPRAVYFQYLSNHYKTLLRAWEAPAAVACTGGGFAFDSARAWLNQEIFPLDLQKVIDALQVLYPTHRFIRGLPGRTIRLVEGKLVESPPCTFLKARPKEQWPSREHAPKVTFMEEFEPACGVHDLPASALPELQVELDDFARYLHTTAMFTALYSLDARELQGRKPTIALVLLTSAKRDRLVMEYDPAACAFVASDSKDPVADYAGVVECWGSDMYRVLRSDLGPTALAFGGMRQWNAFPDELQMEFDGYIWRHTHPLARPARFAALYRRLLAAEPKDVPRVRAA